MKHLGVEFDEVVVPLFSPDTDENLKKYFSNLINLGRRKKQNSALITLTTILNWSKRQRVTLNISYAIQPILRMIRQEMLRAVSRIDLISHSKHP